MLEAEARAGLGVERAPVGEGGLEQRVGADDVGVDEGRGAVDRAVDMAFRCEVQDGVGPRLGEDRVERRPVGPSEPKTSSVEICWKRKRVFAPASSVRQ